MTYVDSSGVLSRPLDADIGGVCDMEGVVCSTGCSEQAEQ